MGWAEAEVTPPVCQPRAARLDRLQQTAQRAPPGANVTHSHPLHVDVEAQCLCCRSMQPFRFASPNDQVVCPFCAKHLGSDKSERRDRDHVELWLDLYTELQDAHAHTVSEARAASARAEATISEVRAEVAQLREAIATDFESAPASIRDALGSEVLTRSERRTELLYRRLDRLMAAIWRIDALHHDADSPGLCSCGTAVASCPEGRAIDGERQELRSWEAKNLQLLRDGARHALPSGHPANLST